MSPLGMPMRPCIRLRFTIGLGLHQLAGESPVPDGHHSRDEQLECIMIRLFAVYCAAHERGEAAMLLHALDTMEAEVVAKIRLRSQPEHARLCLESVLERAEAEVTRL